MIEKHLPENQYSNVIRMIKRISYDKVVFLKHATHAQLKVLGVKRDMKKACKKCPDGSDQHDTGSIVTWMKKIKPEDKEAVKQLVAIDATCHARVNH